jgi:hypothetical protein
MQAIANDLGNGFEIIMVLVGIENCGSVTDRTFEYCLFRKICGLKVAFEHLAGFLKVVHNGPIREWV